MPTTHSNYKPIKSPGGGKDQTVPGQVHSIRAIQERFRRGQSVQTYTAVYDSPLPPGYENMTRIEKLDFAREHAKTIENQRQILAAQKQRSTQKPVISGPPIADAGNQ